MNAISPGLRRYSVKPATSPSTRISKRWRSGSSTTVTSGAVVSAISKILAHWPPRGSPLDDVTLVSHDDELHAVASAQLHQDPGDVRLGGERTQLKVFGDLAVGQPGSDEP